VVSLHVLIRREQEVRHLEYICIGLCMYHSSVVFTILTLLFVTSSLFHNVLVGHRLLTLMSMEPGNEKVYFNLGMLSMDDQKFEEAKQWFDKAIEVLLSFTPSPPIDNIWAMLSYELWSKRGDYQNCSVLYFVLKLCTVISTLRWAVLTVLWIGFCLTGNISLCVDLFVFVCIFFVLHCIVVVSLWARLGGPDGIEA